jgi:tetratricopeptide (TPR) repeat protein
MVKELHFHLVCHVCIFHKKREYDEALKLLNESMEIKRQLGDQYGIAQLLGNMSNVYISIGEDNEALKLLNESMEIAKQIGDQAGVSFALGTIGALLFSKEKYIEALPYTLQAYKILERLGMYDAKIELDNLNIIRNALGDTKYKKILNDIEGEEGIAHDNATAP